MITKDKIENYLFIRHKLFRINVDISNVQLGQLTPWTKSALENDFGKGATQNIKVIKDPKLLSDYLKDLYVQHLESKVYKWDKLI
ncbi:hypothetical protein [Fluviicola taffensis]|uniref:Uncharacterized protein n=1 Tax=Fluviicola taffensis (strain DSM 16823 / NCIMB 13979 / RW262) TaxID=755732 RepID=F2IDF0_FLUTR|nr:hypothetical protein [Fluviicola taffensis]AEA42326.1 hypothetical protein Fluta_0317 [Fluviicola taffensis DSM 16823]